MRKVRVEQCWDMETHLSHDWIQGFWWSRKYRCPGVSDITIDASYCEEHSSKCEIEEVKHRCFFKLTKAILFHNNWIPPERVPNSIYGWQCSCGSFRVRNKNVIKSSMLSWEGVDQTWPS